MPPMKAMKVARVKVGGMKVAAKLKKKMRWNLDAVEVSAPGQWQGHGLDLY